MKRPSPAIVVALSHQRSSASTGTIVVENPLGPRSRLDRDRFALRTQLAALEDYYEMTTAEVVAGRAGDTLPGRLPRSEAARWAELHATLGRLQTEARRGQLALERRSDPRDARRGEAELEAA